MRVVTAAMLALIATVMCDANPRHSAAGETRDAFLARVDAALAQRDARALLDLADLDGWRQSGRPAPDPAAMILPATPVSRVRALSESDILYGDRDGREWRLSLRGDGEHGWRIVLRDRACPAAGGMARGVEFERPAPAQTTASWTPLECWPLPK